MDGISVLIGLIVGILLGATIAWKLSQNHESKKTKQMASTEAELKALLAQQAHEHVSTTKSGLSNLKQQLDILSNSIDNYENALTQPNQPGEKSTFYGEQASVFLRNKTIEINTPKAEIEDAQPRDFANNPSGLFVDNSIDEKVVK